MTVVKYVLAILLTIPVAVLGIVLFEAYVDQLGGGKAAGRRQRKEGFTIRMPGNGDRPSEKGSKR